jgi:hypothetical protein
MQRPEQHQQQQHGTAAPLLQLQLLVCPAVKA